LSDSARSGHGKEGVNGSSPLEAFGRANGKVATGIDREKLTSDERDTYTRTGSWIFLVPDGHIQTAGRITAMLDTSATLSEHGPHPVADGQLAALFCPAMA
jgi:hypothetical protein